MAPPSKKQKWRRVDLSTTEEYLDEKALHEKVDLLETQGNLFTLDTEGCDPLKNLSHRARRIFEESREKDPHSSHQEKKSEGGRHLLNSSEREQDEREEESVKRIVKDTSCLANTKPPLLQVISKHHKKHLLRTMKVRANQDLSQASSSSSSSSLCSTSKSSPSKPQPLCSSSSSSAGFFHKDLIDIWNDEAKKEDASTSLSSNKKQKKKMISHLNINLNEKEKDQEAQKERNDNILLHGAPQEKSNRKIKNLKLLSSSSSTSSTSGDGSTSSSSMKRKREEDEVCPSPESLSSDQKKTGEPLSEAKEDKTSDNSEEKLSPVKKKMKTASSSSFSRVSSLTSRKLKSFDRLRGFVPALQLPKNDESYNPSPVDHERALLISAVRTLEEQEALQKSQATKQQTSHASSLYTRDLRDLENLLLEKKSEMDAQKGDFSRYTRPVNAALTDIGLSPDTVLQLSSKQKQKLLYELVHAGKEVRVDNNGQARLVSSHNTEEGEGHLIEDLFKNEEEEEENEKKGEGEEERFDRSLRMRKKTKQERNRRLRFLQQQRRHGAKVSLKAFRHAIDNASRLIKDVEVDEEEKNLLRKAKHERLEAKIQAAKEGLVKLKIGRNRFIEPPPLAQLPEDLGGSLRTMKAVSGDGSAVASQMLSLQRRGLIELPPTGGASGVYLRRIQKERSRKLHSKRRLRRK